MGVPRSEEEETPSSQLGDMDCGQDINRVSANGQSEVGQLGASSVDRVQREEPTRSDNDNLTQDAPATVEHTPLEDDVINNTNGTFDHTPLDDDVTNNTDGVTLDHAPITEDNLTNTNATPLNGHTESATVGSERLPEEDGVVKRTPEYQPVIGRSRTVGGGGVGGGSSVSVTLLTLNADLNSSRPHSRREFLPSPRIERDGIDMSDIKLIRDFQIRRKYGRRPSHGRPPPTSRNKTFVDLGLSGRRYFANNKDTTTTTTTNATTPSSLSASTALDSPRTGKPSVFGDHRRLHSTATPSFSSRSRADEERSKDFVLSDRNSSAADSAFIKGLQSPVPSFPPLSPGVPRVGVRSENSYSSRHTASSSLLVNHFGFSTIRPDTFSGMQRQRKLKLAPDEKDDLIKELEQHAQRQILACQNMGFTHRGSRAAESVISLKHTVSPSAFHSQSFFTRHVPRDDRTGTPSSLPLEAEDRRSGKRVTHPAPGGKLTMPRLLMQDRQDQAAHRASLPTVSGNSLQVILAQSNAK